MAFYTSTMYGRRMGKRAVGFIFEDLIKRWDKFTENRGGCMFRHAQIAAEYSISVTMPAERKLSDIFLVLVYSSSSLP